MMKNIKLFDSPIKILGGSIIIVEGILLYLVQSDGLVEKQKSWIIIGMISALFLTIIAAVIIELINKRKTSSFVVADTETKKYQYSIFISYPIAGAKNKTEKNEIKDFIIQIEKKLKTWGYKEIFNATTYFDKEHDNQPPAVASKIDLKAVHDSKSFILLYPTKVATSALVELGYALGGDKNILICTTNSKILPFLVRGFNEAFHNVRIIEYDNLEHLSDILEENHSQYLK
ncbi:MAG: hypothetical protein GQ564_00100 [Bacteroidales bacterium]|nr:hypothetical protein [Bacteroidales bacterium]